MTIFDALSNALAALIGADAEIAGWILGFVIIVALLIGMIWVLGDTASEGLGLTLPAALGMTFAVLVGWWPIWTLVFIALFIALIIVKPFPSGSGP